MEEQWSGYIIGLAQSNQSLAELARRTGIPRETLWGIKSRRQEPQLKTVRSLAAFVGVRPSELIDIVEC